MSVPTGAGNYPPGVTDNDPHFDDDTELCPECGEERCECEPETYLDDVERFGEREERVDPQTGFVDD